MSILFGIYFINEGCIYPFFWNLFCKGEFKLSKQEAENADIA